MVKRTLLSNAIGTLASLLLITFATEHQARAYVDPGSGALIWQLMGGAFIGLLFYARRIVSWFRSMGDRKH
jgi:hypothetical protein